MPRTLNAFPSTGWIQEPDDGTSWLDTGLPGIADDRIGWQPDWNAQGWSPDDGGRHWHPAWQHAETETTISPVLPFVVQIQGVDYTSLSTENFMLGIVDPDDSRLTPDQIASLNEADKTVIAYESVGEAQSFRSYWQSSWTTDPPSWVIGADTAWPGDYFVKYWDPAWQQIVIDRAVADANAGYDGVEMDVVDRYNVAQVAEAAGGVDQARAYMVDLIGKISAATKAANPDFKIIANGAKDLLVVDPNDPASASNDAYLAVIDGQMIESTFYNPDGSVPSSSATDQAYLRHAVDAGKTVLSIDYPADATQQADYLAQAIAAGYVPYAAGMGLAGTVAQANSDYWSQHQDQLPEMASLLDTGPARHTSDLYGADPRMGW